MLDGQWGEAGRSNRVFSPIYIAVREGDTKILQILINQNVSRSRGGKGGWLSLIHYAAHMARPAILKVEK